jgi:DNA-binding CsgD family transcriptional regulator
VIDALLDGARQGRSGVLVIRGEPGIGKTSLLAYAEERAHDMRVLRGIGVETEADIPYASLHLLLHRGLDRLDALPAPQAAALAGALGLAPTSGEERFQVGVAALSLLAELAEDGPLLCLIDDAHWLDQASARALRFAAHRLFAEGIVLLFGARDGFDPAGLSEHRLDGLDEESAARLLADTAPALTGPMRARIIDESAGNPLALLELPRTAGLRAYERDPLPLPERLQSVYAARIAELPQDAQRALLVAALVDGGELDLITATCAELGVEPAALGAAERSGLIRVAGTQVSFVHPLMRAAAFQHGTYDLRLGAHAILAGLLPDRPDRRAWHLAAAATGPDEVAARALEEAAERAKERSALSSASAALERAAALTADSELKGRRLIAAAVTTLETDQPERAKRLIEAGASLVPDAPTRATLPRLRAQIAFAQGAPHLAHDLLISGAAEVAGEDRAAAGLMLVEAARNATLTSDIGELLQAITRLRSLGLRSEDDLDLAARSAVATALLWTEGPAHAVPIMRTLVTDGSRQTGGVHLSRRVNAVYFAHRTGDFQAARDMALAAADECRATGELRRLVRVHLGLAAAEIHLGRFSEAAATATEGLLLIGEADKPNRAGCMEGMLAWIAAVQGDAGRCAELAASSLSRFEDNHIANGLAWSQWALALLDLVAGRFGDALGRLDTAMNGPVRHQIQSILFAPDQIEAAARLGRSADEPLRRFRDWADACGHDWAGAVLHRCRALLEPDAERAHEHFRTAVRLHAHGGGPWEAARTRLAFGERLRRDRHRTAARTHLRAALDAFERVGARPWAERARTELRAAGEAGSASAATDRLTALSPQEFQIVRLAAAGLTNRQIGTRLFLSPKTVSYHLYRAFPKLNVTSRAQLGGLDLA